MSYAVWIGPDVHGCWQAGDLRFPTREQAAAYAAGVWAHWPFAREYRVIKNDDPANCSIFANCLIVGDNLKEIQS